MLTSESDVHRSVAVTVIAHSVEKQNSSSVLLQQSAHNRGGFLAGGQHLAQLVLH
jgi:hypothetical protein